MKISQASETNNRRYRVGLTFRGRNHTLGYRATLTEAERELRSWWGPARGLPGATGWIVDRHDQKMVFEARLPPTPYLVR